MPSVVHEPSQLPLVSSLLVFSFMCLQLPHGALTCALADRIAVSAFSKHLDISAINGWPRAENYSSDCCRWPGVSCSWVGAKELRIVSLDLAWHGLTGVLTSGLAGLDELRVLNLSGNSFYGAVPSELLRMQNLRVLDLSQNGFTGELGGDLPPAPAPDASGIRILDVSFNSLSTLHAGIFVHLPELRSFSGESNLLTGTLPTPLSSGSELECLNMANNSLYGNLGLFDFSRLPRLRALHLDWNKLSGNLPETLSRCRELRVVNLRRNSFSGTVPSSFQQLQSLAFFDIGDNNITGIVQALRVLQECRALVVLILTTNFHGEAMPDDDAGEGNRGFPSMRLLGIANCDLTGAVPTWLLASARLSVLDLSWNRLSGRLPPWLGNFDALFRIDLSGNSLTGDIPVSLAFLKSLASNASVVQLSLSDEYGVRLYNWHVERGQLWYNSYIPPSLDLSRNGLTGTIPEELGNLRALNLLNLSWNSLSEMIPSSLASLTSLQTLDLSNNELTGEIPWSLAMLTFLSCFDVSYNRLNGTIPDRGQFSTFPCSNFAGNPGLYVKYCDGQVDAGTPGTDGDLSSMIVIEDLWLPFWLGMVTGVLATLFAHVLALEHACNS
ncbi:hypothetical protein PR202_ga04589 [Eleusine coracana subsp. coracana]|uniref:Leucine-rich repeat-containing N-terminal plant-type domain-containing protein n=1 Tax=Eleusine coracana subsp. coracana TaxID=191504 RepID=A0AAV5BRD9_ELECO|nr:hypothetical protein QOZ80_5AG0373970 [Eleusine coracana subsp. coracana]GJM88517.1 hypothetical protein PR202_ga04589 [Eleusine coracana subsp. coracana]